MLDQSAPDSIAAAANADKILIGCLISLAFRIIANLFLMVFLQFAIDMVHIPVVRFVTGSKSKIRFIYCV